jgi:hypothetical protein
MIFMCQIVNTSTVTKSVINIGIKFELRKSVQIKIIFIISLVLYIA